MPVSPLGPEFLNLPLVFLADLPGGGGGVDSLSCQEGVGGGGGGAGHLRVSLEILTWSGRFCQEDRAGSGSWQSGR